VDKTTLFNEVVMKLKGTGYLLYDIGTALFWVIMQRVVVISFRRSGKPIGPICRGQDETDRLSETAVRNCHYSLRNNSEERSSHLLRSRSLKTRILCDMFSDVKALQSQLNLVQRRISELF
jgi:hypothetical protein